MAAGVGLVLDYQRSRPEITTRHREARSRAEPQDARLTMHRTLVGRVRAGDGPRGELPGLDPANALHLAVEQNSLRPADQEARAIISAGVVDDQRRCADRRSGLVRLRAAFPHR